MANNTSSIDEDNLMLLEYVRTPEYSNHALTRVMSPNQPMMNVNSGVLTGLLRCPCQVCSQLMDEPSICATCGTWGHPVCLQASIFQDYIFCGRCFQDMKSRYEAIQSAQDQHAWRTSISHQLSVWKSRAENTFGASASIGVTMGGAAATVAGAVAAAAQGFVQGATGAGAAERRVDIPKRLGMTLNSPCRDFVTRWNGGACPPAWNGPGLPIGVLEVTKLGLGRRAWPSGVCVGLGCRN